MPRGPEDGRPFVTRYWVCEDCAHFWAATLPDDEMPECCENCQHRILEPYDSEGDAGEASQAILDAA